MPGTGHSSRYKGSISNRNSKPAFQVLAPWNSKKNGNINQVPVSSGGEAVNFKLMNAKMMSNYNKNTDEFTFDCSLNVLGNKVVSGTTTFNGKVICRDNVDICGNLTIDGVLTAQTALIQDLSAINITDVCDNVLTLGNHESFSTKHMRGIFMSHLDNSGTSFTDEFSFMGFDPCGNTCGGLVSNDTHGQFVFLTDASFNSNALQNDCNITGEAGRVVVGTLDISGSLRYGNGVGNSGAPTQNVTGQADSSMHLVGRTIIAQKGLNSAQLDISGGIDVVGPSKLTDLSGAYIDISGGNIDIAGATSNKISLVANGNILLNSNDGTSSIIEIHNNQGDSANAIALTAPAGGVDIDAGAGVTIDASGASNFTTSAGILTLDGATGVDISGNAGTVNITTTGTVDINAGNVTISGTTTLGSTTAVTVTTAGVVSIPNPTTDPTTSSNSALKVTGGVSIGGTCHVGDGVIVSGALSMSGGSISDVNGLAATGAISGFSLTDGSATLSSGSLTGATNITATGNITGGSLTATGDISCNGITILANGIKLPHTDSTSSTLTGGGFIATVTTNGLSGRIQVPTGSNLSAGAAGGIEWTNTTLQSDSIVLLTLDSSKNSINAWDSCTVTRSYNSGSAPANNIIITNNDSANWTAAAGETYYINFLIINPT